MGKPETQAECLLCDGNRLAPVPLRQPELLYHRCRDCDLIFMDPKDRLTRDEEHLRYQLHQNDPRDPRYREFLRPVCEAIRENVPMGGRGLDYGSGPGPAVSVFLSDAYPVANFDPFFFPETELLRKTYDFIVCSEVAEHFYSPAGEFRKLKTLLNPGGVLICMTLFHNPQTDFENWYYRRDPTHVVFYSHETAAWIAKNLGFRELRFHNERVAVLFA